VISFAQGAVEALLMKIEAGKTPEKVAENDYLMKCSILFVKEIFIDRGFIGIMRIVITARAGLVAGHERILGRVVAILGAVSRNPSNPNFNQYTFETVSAFIR